MAFLKYLAKKMSLLALNLEGLKVENKTPSNLKLRKACTTYE